MPNKKKKSEDIKLKQPTEATVEVGYVQEQSVENVSDLTIYSTEYTGKPQHRICFSRGEKGTEEYQELDEELNIVNIYTEDAEFLKLFELASMRERIVNGESLQQVYGDLKNYILANKELNPDGVQRAISALLGDAENHYDEGTDNWLGISGFTRKHQGDSAQEILGKVLNTPEKEEIKGFVCSTIHEFGMRLLDECGIKATMLAGGTGSSNHTCLLWQRSDGKYVQSNYDNSYTLEATNMKDAAREVYKRNLGLINNGYIYFIDNDGSYQEFAMKEEAVWGNELDKRDYNSQSVFDHTIASQPSINGRINVSNLGSVSAEVSGTLAYGNDSVSKETSYSIGFKRSHNTSLADKSTGVGLKLVHKSERVLDSGNKQYSETKVIADYTHLHTDAFVADRNFMLTIDHREFNDKEQLERLNLWYQEQYESNHPIEGYQNYYNWCEWYLNRFENEAKNIDSPISKEEFISDAKKTYVSGDGIPYEQLDEHGKKNALECIESNWEHFLINNYYNEAKDIVLTRLNDTKDHIDNYDKYKKEYVDEYLSCFLDVYRSPELSEPTKTIKTLDTSNFSLFIKKVFGKENTLLKDDGIELINGYQFSGTIGVNDVLTKSVHHTDTEFIDNVGYTNEYTKEEAAFTAFGGDIRLAAEEGLKLDMYNNTSLFSTSVSGGVVADMSLKSGTLTPSVYPGVKLNGSTIFQARPSDNVTFGAGLNGYSVITKPSIDYGASAQLQGNYKPSGSNIRLFGNASYGLEQQRIRIGGFNEQTENVRTFGVNVGAQLGNRTSVSLGYNGRFDKLNSTRNRSIISLNAGINL